LWIVDHEAADGWGMMGKGGDVVQKCTRFEHEMPETSHVVQICTTFGKILYNWYKCSAKMHHLASMPVWDTLDGDPHKINSFPGDLIRGFPPLVAGVFGQIRYEQSVRIFITAISAE
jgi:hypothetical protein